MFAALVGLALATSPCVAAPPWTDADLVAGNVDLYLHVDDASGLRRELSAMPLVAAFRAMFVDEEVSERWALFAQRLRLSEERCFDELLGRDVVFIMRRGEDACDWLLATRIDEATYARFFKGLGGQHCGRGIAEFSCMGVVAAWRPPTLFIAQSQESPLFRETLERDGIRRSGGRSGPVELARDTAVNGGTAGARAAPAVLADDPLLRAAAAWPASRVQLFVRHPAAIEGASVISMHLEPPGALLRHRSRFDRLPLAAPEDDQELANRSLLRRFESTALVGVLRRQGESPAMTLLSALLPQARPCEAMRGNAGERWLLLVGDVDGSPYVPCRVPAVAVAMEVRDAHAGRRCHEAFLSRTIRNFNELYATRLGGEIPPPEVAACTDLEAPRHCDLNRLIRTICGDHAMVRGSSLHWRTVGGDDGNWQVYASHREWLDRVTRQLEGPCRASRPAVAASAQVRDEAQAPSSAVRDGGAKAAGADASIPEGFIDGRATAAMLDGWGAAAGAFASGDPERFREAVAVVSSMLRAVDRVRWNLDRPDPGVIETTVRIEFARPGPDSP